jgi:hypothetical protein
MPLGLLFALAIAAQTPAAPPAPTAAQVPAQPPATALTQWEYTLLESYGINPGATQEFLGLRSEPTAKYMNALGAQGWELVTALREKDGERVYFVFKRPIPALR